MADTNKTTNLTFNKSLDKNYDYLNHKYKELLDENWEKLDSILAGKELNINQFGAYGDGKNYTTEIQNAIDNLPSYGGIVYVPPGMYLIDGWATGSEAYYTTGGISLRSNMILYMAPGATFKAVTNNHPNYTIVRAVDVENVLILGGTFIGERNEHTGTTGEDGYGISIIGSKNVTIRDSITKDCWGDGVYVGPNRNGIECENVDLSNVKSSNNRRFGINIAGCVKARLEKCIISNINGVLPETGINIKPLNIDTEVKDIVVDTCFSIDNNGMGIRVHSGVDNAIVVTSTFRANKGYGVYTKQVESIKVIDNTIEDNSLDGFLMEETDLSHIKDNTIRRNLKNGLLIKRSNSNIVSGNTSSANSQETNNVYGNIALDDESSNNNVQNNTVRKGSGDNSPRYGIGVLNANCERNFIVNNDIHEGGVTKEFYNVGKDTIENGNRTENGISINANMITITDKNNLITALNVDGAIDEIIMLLKNHIESSDSSHTAASIILADPDNKTSATNVEDAIKELYEEIKKARTYAP